MEEIYKDYISFQILGQEVFLYSDVLETGRNTVVQIEEDLQYIGSEYPTISSAIFSWQEYYGFQLTEAELHKVMIDNKLIEEK